MFPGVEVGSGEVSTAQSTDPHTDRSTAPKRLIPRWQALTRLNLFSVNVALTYKMNWKIYFIMLNDGETKITFLRHLERLFGPSPPSSPSFLMKYADYDILSRFSLSLFICLYSKLVKMIPQSVPIRSLSVPSCIIVEKMRVNVTLKGPCIYFQTGYSNIFHWFSFFPYGYFICTVKM